MDRANSPRVQRDGGQGRSFDRRRFLSGSGAVLAGATVLAGRELLVPPATLAAGGKGASPDQGGAVFNVKAYGATGDGRTDDTASIRRALHAAQGAGGGIVFFPQGIYRVGDNITRTSGGASLLADGMHLKGAGVAATTIRVQSGYGGDVVAIPANTVACSISALSFDAWDYAAGGPAQRTGGTTLHLTGCAHIVIEDVNMRDQYNGCLIDGDGAGVIHVHRGWWTNTAPGGITLWLNSPSGADFYFSHLTFDIDGQAPLAGIRLQGGGGIDISHVDVLFYRHGLLIDPDGGRSVIWGFVTSAAFDTCHDSCIQIAPQARGGIYGFNFVDSWSSSAGFAGNTTNQLADGCTIAPGPGGIVDGVQFVGHRFLGNANNGLLVSGSGATNIYVDASVASGNSPQQAGGHGFAFQDGCRRFAVRNCCCGPYAAAFGPAQDYRDNIYVAPGCDSYILAANMVAGSSVPGIDDNGGPDKVLANNLQ